MVENIFTSTSHHPFIISGSILGVTRP